jgi:hypothetical protein
VSAAALADGLRAAPGRARPGGAVFVNGKLAERPGQDAPPEAA